MRPSRFPLASTLTWMMPSRGSVSQLPTTPVNAASAACAGDTSAQLTSHTTKAHRRPDEFMMPLRPLSGMVIAAGRYHTPASGLRSKLQCRRLCAALERFPAGTPMLRGEERGAVRMGMRTEPRLAQGGGRIGNEVQAVEELLHAAARIAHRQHVAPRRERLGGTRHDVTKARGAGHRQVVGKHRAGEAQFTAQGPGNPAARKTRR